MSQPTAAQPAKAAPAAATIQLPTARIAAKRKSPRFLLLYGKSKSGKTTKIAELDNCLIIDTEEGTEFLDVMALHARSIAEFTDVMKALLAAPRQYDYIALDTVDNLAYWWERRVLAENKVKSLIDIPYGGGHAQVRDKVLDAITRLKTIARKGIIVCGHLKKTQVEETGEVSAASLDLSGKLKNMLMADADAIGLVYWTAEGRQMISFKGQEGVVESESGSRLPHLRNQVIEFDWSKIYID